MFTIKFFAILYYNLNFLNIMGGSKTQCAPAQQGRNNLNLYKSAAFAPYMANMSKTHSIKIHQSMNNLKMA